MLEMTGSEQNPELAVMLYRGRLQLISGNAIYSWDDLYHNFTIAFEKLRISERKVQDVLILGLGLGSIAYILETVHKITCRYTAVEWDEVVAELATKYTLSRLKSPIEIITADAEIFVAVCEEQFDLITIDIFEDDLTPPQFETPGFLNQCKELLRPGGLLMFNRLYSEHKDRVAADRFFQRSFSVVFPEAFSIDTRGNLMLCWEKPVGISQ